MIFFQADFYQFEKHVESHKKLHNDSPGPGTQIFTVNKHESVMVIIGFI